MVGEMNGYLRFIGDCTTGAGRPPLKSAFTIFEGCDIYLSAMQRWR